MKESKIEETNFLTTHGKLIKDWHIDFLYTANTYAGVLASSIERLKSEEEEFIERHKSFFVQNLNYNNFIQIDVIKSYQYKYTELLNPRVCMALLISNDCKEIGVIWYDEGYYTEVVKSLASICYKIDWTKAQEFDY